MSDIRAPDVKEQAKKDYLNGMKYKDLANKYGVSLNTIKSWKQRYNWDRKSVHTKSKKVCIQKNGANKSIVQEPMLSEITELESTELTDKQRLFCIYYIKYFNATKAYKKAYECDYNTAMVNGCNLLRNTKVKAEITILKADKLKGAMLEPGDVLQKYIDIAFADITDYVRFGQEEVPVMTMFGPAKVKDENGEEHELTKIVNVVKFKESVNVDGTIISEVKQGRDGASIKLHDKMKALDWLANHMDLLDTATKEKLQLERDKFNAEQKKENGDGKDVVIKVTLEDDE